MSKKLKTVEVWEMFALSMLCEAPKNKELQRRFKKDVFKKCSKICKMIAKEMMAEKQSNTETGRIAAEFIERGSAKVKNIKIC